MWDKQKHNNKHKEGMLTCVKHAQRNKKHARAKWTGDHNRVSQMFTLGKNKQDKDKHKHKKKERFRVIALVLTL